MKFLNIISYQILYFQRNIVVGTILKMIKNKMNDVKRTINVAGNLKQ